MVYITFLDLITVTKMVSKACTPFGNVARASTYGPRINRSRAFRNSRAIARINLVDLAQWMSGDGTAFDYQRDVALEAARQWPTATLQLLASPKGEFCRASDR